MLLDAFREQYIIRFGGLDFSDAAKLRRILRHSCVPGKARVPDGVSHLWLLGVRARAVSAQPSIRIFAPVGRCCVAERGRRVFYRDQAYPLTPVAVLES